MLKQRFKMIAAGVLAAVLSLSLTTGCGGLNGNAAVLKVDGETVSLGVANFAARISQSQYETYYGISADSWKQNISGDETTYEDMVKKEVMDSLKAMVLEKQHADEFKAELTDEDHEAITAAAEKFLKDNKKDALEATTADQETLEQYLELSTIHDRVEHAIRDTVSKDDITDKEAAQKKRVYVYFAFSTTNAETGAVDTLDEKQKKQLKTDAEAFASAAASAEDFKALAKQEGYEASEAAFDASSTTPDTALVEAADKLKKGEVTDVIEGTSGYYVAKLISTFDKEATETKKNSLLAQKQSEAVEKQVKKWKKAAKIKVYKKRWAKVRFDKQGVTMKQEPEKTEDK